MLLPLFSALEKETDKSDFEKLYEEYSTDVMRRALFLTKSKFDAEDAAQETWFAVAEHIKKGSIQRVKATKAFIMKILQYKTADLWRRKKKESTVLEYRDDLGFSETGFAEKSDDEALFSLCEKEEIDVIARCIDSLGETYKDTLLLFYFYDKKPKEIASLMNVSPKTVEKRIERGRALLQMKLREEDKK